MNHNFRTNYFVDEDGVALLGDQGYHLQTAAVYAYLNNLKNSSSKNVNIRIARDGDLHDHVNIRFLRWDEVSNTFFLAKTIKKCHILLKK